VNWWTQQNKYSVLVTSSTQQACLSKFFINQQLTNYLHYCVNILNITLKITSLTRVLGVQVSFICAGLNASVGAMWTLVGLISRVAHLVTSKRIMISCYILTFVTMERFLACAEKIVNWYYHSADIAKNNQFNILWDFHLLPGQVKMKLSLDIDCSSSSNLSTATRQCHCRISFSVNWLPTWPLNPQTQPWRHLSLLKWRDKERRKERKKNRKNHSPENPSLVLPVITTTINHKYSVKWIFYARYARLHNPKRYSSPWNSLTNFKAISTKLLQQ
jgi:hypothetical protein